MTTSLPLVMSAPRGRAKPPVHLADLSMDERVELAKERGLPGMRARQLSTHYFEHLVTDPEQMTDLPKASREALAGGLLGGAIGNLLDRFTPAECANYLRNSGYAAI